MRVIVGWRVLVRVLVGMVAVRVALGVEVNDVDVAVAVFVAEAVGVGVLPRKMETGERGYSLVPSILITSN